MRSRYDRQSRVDELEENLQRMNLVWFGLSMVFLLGGIWFGWILRGML